jgi:hypothetical protein
MSPELIRKEDLHEKYRSINKSRQRLALKKPVVCITNPNENLSLRVQMKLESISILRQYHNHVY